MNNLRVESYETKEVADKKQKISKRVAATGAVVVLGLFGLTSLAGCDTIDREQVQTTPSPSPFPHILGGSGSWFVSILERE